MFSIGTNQKRTNEAPMDFEWDNRGGPSDPKSPFPQHNGQKRGFDTPQKPSSFIKASSTTASQFRNPSFTTPRKAFDADMFSEASGVDSSPGDNADSEATPEQPNLTRTMTTFPSGPSERKPMFGRYGAGFAGNSPGRGDQRRGKYANAITIASRLRKRQRSDRDYGLVKGQREDSESESDAGDTLPRTRGKRDKGEREKPNWFSSLLTGIESRPGLPHVLSFYAELSMNFFLLGLTVFGIWTFWTTIRSDVDKAAEEARASVIAEIAKCARDYVDNKCGKDMRLPALEVVCDNWELCMNRDPRSVGIARVSAHTFAEIFNSFIEPISYKAMIFVVVIITVCILVNNLAFGMFRSKTSHMPTAPAYFPNAQHQQQSFQWGAPPQTPQHPAGYDIYGQNVQAIMPSHTPGQRSPSKGNRSPSKGNRSPVKGDRY